MTDSAIREGHLMPASNIVDEMLKNASIPRKCEICGKEYIKTELNLLGKTKIVYSLPCNCLQLQKEKQELEKRKERLRKKYQKANIGKRYIGITLEKLRNLKTEHINDAVKYISNFNPESGNSIHMIGNFGNGKTSVGYAITSDLLRRGFNCLATSWNEIVSRLYYAKSFNSEETIESVLNELSKFDFVMLDEFVINLKKEEEIILASELIDRWYKDNKCFLVINNPCDISEMKTIPKLGKLFDRIREQAELWVFEHKSYRVKK